MARMAGEAHVCQTPPGLGLVAAAQAGSHCQLLPAAWQASSAAPCVALSYAMAGQNATVPVVLFTIVWHCACQPQKRSFGWVVQFLWPLCTVPYGYQLSPISLAVVFSHVHLTFHVVSHLWTRGQAAGSPASSEALLLRCTVRCAGGIPTPHQCHSDSVTDSRWSPVQ